VGKRADGGELRGVKTSQASYAFNRLKVPDGVVKKNTGHIIYV